MRLSTFYLLFSSTALAAAGTKGQNLQECVKRVFGSGAMDRIVTPNDDTYTDARIGESIQFDEFPQLIAYAKDPSEVAPLVLCAKRTGYKAVPRSGGHHFLAYSALNGTLVIDVSHIDHVSISEDRTSAQVGAGIRLGPLYTALATVGRDWPGGICPTVGLSGFLGVGGFNMQMRQTGLGVDHVLSAKVVLADGRTVTASPRQNPDLFWAIRGGGGGTYGIVVEWTLRLSAFPRSAMVLINWNEPNTTVQVANKWIGWAPDTDKALTTQLNVRANMSQLIGWCYGCSLEKAQALVNSSGLLSIGKPQVFISGNCSSMNSRMIGFIANACMPDDQVAKLVPLALNFPQQPFSKIDNYTQFAWSETLQDPSAPVAQPWGRIIRISKSFFLQRNKKVAPDQITNVVRRIQSLPTSSNVWGEWHSWNIAGEASNSAFAWRDQTYAHLEFIVNGSTDPTIQAGYLAWAQDLENYFRPIVGPATYTGYMDASISTPRLESYFGSNVPRLSQIKRHYDPFDFFSSPATIQPVLLSWDLSGVDGE